eukprot:203146_1
MKTPDYAAIVRKDPHNTEAWTALLTLAQRQPISECRSLLESFLKTFPTAARFWKMLIEKEIEAKNFDGVEVLFQRCLFPCLDVELWKTYIEYIKIVKKGASDELQALNTAYEFVLKHVGQDLDSSPIWQEHCAFLKEKLENVQSAEKLTAIRTVYHHAIVTPMGGVEDMWREYDAWEHINDANLAKGMLSAFTQKHQNARHCMRQRKRHKRSIHLSMLARPSRGTSQNRERDYQQLVHWCKLIDYEKTNPQRLQTMQLEERVVFTYKQALMYLRHYAEIWTSRVTCQNRERGYRQNVRWCKVVVYYENMNPQRSRE